jgi:hypothetical protein
MAQRGFACRAAQLQNFEEIEMFEIDTFDNDDYVSVIVTYRDEDGDEVSFQLEDSYDYAQSTTLFPYSGSGKYASSPSSDESYADEDPPQAALDILPAAQKWFNEYLESEDGDLAVEPTHSGLDARSCRLVFK